MEHDLAKVLWYYGLIPVVDEAVQKIVCPLHDDVNPSMLADFTTGRWHCFGCGKSGDARKLVSEMEWKYHKLNDLESAIKYGEILKSKKVSDIKIPKSVRMFKKPNKKTLYNEAYDYYHCLSKVDWRTDKEPVEVCDTRSYMEKRGYSKETLNRVKAKITYNSYYQLIFPILDNGKFKGWVCRTTDKELEARRKYLYNEGFSRVTTLCGDYGNKDYVIVVEGFMDRLRFIELGVESDNVVAILGWKMSDEQQQKLKSKGVKTIISALDNDSAGKKGTLFLKTTSFNIVRFKYINGIKDPGEMSETQFKKCYRATMSEYRDKFFKNKNKKRSKQNGTVR